MPPPSQSLVELQDVLLPPVLPSVSCTEVAAAYKPHNDELRVGGDWYDLIDRSDNQVVAIIGDVVGHGLREVSAMGQLRAAANALGRRCAQPADLLQWMDEFASEIPAAHYATMIVMMLDGSSTVRVASAGHPPALHVKRNGEFRIVEEGRRTPLTLAPATSYLGAEIEYEVHDLLMLFTDGLFERRSSPFDETLYDLGEFVAARREGSCTSIIDQVMDVYAADAEDDIAVILLRPRNHRAPGFHLQELLPSTVSRRH